MLCCFHNNFPSRNYSGCGSSLQLLIAFAIAVTLMATGSAWASTGYSSEIYNISVQNQTPTTVDIVWDTVHPSSSQVVIARDQNYAGERRVPVNSDPRLVNHHRVTVDRLMPYDTSAGLGTYYFYVASVDVNNVISTSPGPFNGGTGDPATQLLPLQTLPPDANSKSNFTLYTYGPTKVYAGSDLYFGLKLAQLAGNHPNLYVHNVSGYNNGSDGVVKAVVPRTVRSNPETIRVHLQCYEYNPNNSDAADQYYDGGKNMGLCWNFEYHLMTVRLRTSSQTMPGVYSVTVTIEDNGQAVPVTYYFTVLAAAKAPAVRTSYGPPIPGKDSWESNMTKYGHKFCDDKKNSGSRDSLNAAGNFLTGWAWEHDAWYYDGGRVYQQIQSYTNDTSWNHCALTILDPYRQWVMANDAKMHVWAIFPYGMLMNYWRTGDTTNATAIHALATNSGSANYGGWVDANGIREAAYIADVRIADELLTGKRDRLLAKNIDKLLGHLDMLDNGQLGASHPFMVGLAMETLIHYYDMTVAEGHPDYRVPATVKRGLDALWRDYYVPKTHAFRYTRWDVPSTDTWIVLNGLVAPAYAWYWNLTGDTDSLSRGDELFQHTLDDPGNSIWTGKEFSQVYKWSFDYVRWRSGLDTSSIASENNPFAGAYPDTEPPIETQVAVSNLKDTTATVTWKTYENADSQIVYGVSGGYYPLQSGLQDSGQGTMSHTVTLLGLTPGTTYHYRVNSHDAARNLASRADATFTTTGGTSGGGGLTMINLQPGAGSQTTGGQPVIDPSNTGNTAVLGGSGTGSDATVDATFGAASGNVSSQALTPAGGDAKNSYSPRQMLSQ